MLPRPLPSTSCSVFVLCAVLSAQPVLASAPPEVAEERPAITSYWAPQLYQNLRLGNKRHIAETGITVPFTQLRERVFFGDLRGRMDDDSSHEFNLGVGYRGLLADDRLLLGAYAYRDRLSTRFDNTFYQNTLGVELQAERWSVRLNGYRPSGSGSAAMEEPYTVSDGNFGDAQLAVVNSQLVFNTPGGSETVYQLQERALGGYDLELGYRLPVGDGQSLWLYGGYYDFDESGMEAISGPRARVQWQRGLDQLVEGTRVHLGVEWQRDSVRGSRGYATLGIQVPIGSGGRRYRASGAADWYAERMMQRPVRDVDIVTAAHTAVLGHQEREASQEAAVFHGGDLDGQRVGGVGVARAGASGAGTHENPASLSGAAGQLSDRGILVLDAAGGDFNGDLTLDFNDLHILSGNAGISVRAENTAGLEAVFGASGDAATLGGELILSGDRATILQVNLAGGLLAEGVQGLTLRQSTSGDIRLHNVGGNIQLDQVNMSGLYLDGGSAVVAHTGQLSRNQSGDLLRIENLTGGAVHLNGPLSASGAAGGIHIAHNSNSQVHINAPVSLDLNQADALVLSDNDNDTLVHVDGGLNIDTHSGAGLLASGGGTLVISGGDNHIHSRGPGAALRLEQVASDIQLASLTSEGASGNGVSLIDVSGTVQIDETHIDGASGTGLLVSGGNSHYHFGDTQVGNTGGAGVHLSNTGAQIDFGSLSLHQIGGNGVHLDNVSGNTTVGDLEIHQAGGVGLSIVDSSGTLSFGATDIHTTGGHGLLVNNSTGALVFDTLAIGNAGSDGVRLTGSGLNLQTGDLHINGAGQHGLNLAGAAGQLSFGAIQLQSVGQSGIRFVDSNTQFSAQSLHSTGGVTAIDLTRARGSIEFAQGGQLQGFSGTGVQLSSSDSQADSANAHFVFGGGHIAAGPGAYVLDAVGLNPSTGLYNFTGVSFSGEFRFETALADPSLYFVGSSASGDGSGSSPDNLANAASAQARADSGQFTRFVFVNDGADIDFSGLLDGTFHLGEGQQITGFGSGQSFGGSLPANLIGNFPNPSIGDPTGLGAAVLTTSAGNSVITLTGGNNQIGGVSLSGGDYNIWGEGLNNLNLANTTLTGAGASALHFLDAQGDLLMSGNTVSSDGVLLSVLGGESALSLLAGSGGGLTGNGISVLDTLGGSVHLSGAQLVGNGAPTVTLDNNVASVTLTDTSLASTTNHYLFSIDQGSGSSGAITLNNVTQSGTLNGGAFLIGGGDRDINASGFDITGGNLSAHLIDIDAQGGGTISLGNITSDGHAGSAHVIRVTGQSGGTLNFGAVDIDNFNSAGNNAVSLAGSGAVRFGGLDIQASAGMGLTASGGLTLGIDQSSRIHTTNGQALSLNNVVIHNDGITLDSVRTTSASGVGTLAHGIHLQTISGGTLQMDEVQISSAGNRGINIQTNSNDMVFNDLDIQGGTRALTLIQNSGEISFNNGTFGNTLDLGGFGMRIEQQTAAGTVNLNNINAQTPSASTLSLANNSGTVNATGGTWTHSATQSVVLVDNVSGDINIGANLVHTGDSSEQGVVTIDGTSGTVLFSGNMTNSNGAYLARIGNLSAITGGSITLTGTLTDSNSRGSSIHNIGAAATVTLNGLTTNTTTGGNHGLTLLNIAGNVNLNGTTSLSNLGGSGVLANNISGAVTINNLIVDGANAYGLRVGNATASSGTLTINGGSINGTTDGGILANNANLSLNNLILGGSGALANTGIEVVNTDAANRTVSLDNLTVDALGRGIYLRNTGAGDLRLAVDGNTVNAGTGAGMELNGTAGAGTLYITSLNGNTIETGTGGLLVDDATFDANPDAAGIQQVAGGNTAIGDLTNTTDIDGDGLWLNDVLGNIGFGTLNIGNDGGTGLYIRDADGKGGTFSFGNTGGSINTSNGTALDIDPVTMASTFTSVTSTDAAGHGVLIDQISGTITIGTTTVNNAGGSGIVVIDSDGNFSFGNTTIDTTGNHGLTLNGATGAISFNNLDIENVTNTGVDFEGFSGIFNADTLNVDGGATAIDLTNAGGTITVTNGGTLQGFSDVGVQFSRTDDTADTANAQFTFGGGSITATASAYVVDAIGLDPASGLYDFTGVTITGNSRFAPGAGIVGDLFFVAASATGSGDGSSTNNRADAAAAQTRADTGDATTFVFINDGSTIDFTGLTNNSFTLNNGQVISGFGNDNSFDTNIPVNLIGDFGAGEIDDPTGNGAAILTTSGGNVITLADNNRLSHVDVNGGDVAVFGENFTDFTLNSVTFSNQTDYLFDFRNVAGTISLSGTQSDAGGLLFVDGSSASIQAGGFDFSQQNATGPAVSIANQSGGTIQLGDITSQGSTATHVISVQGQTGGTVNFGAVDIDGFDSAGNDAVSLAGNGAVHFDSLDIQADAGRGLTASGGLTLGIDQSNHIHADAGPALNLNNVAIAPAGITFGSVEANNTGPGNDGIRLQNISGGDLHFDQVQISNAGARGIEVLGHSNDLFFDNVTINGGQRYITLAQSAGDVTLSNATLGGVSSASGVGISVEEQQAGSTINLNNAYVTTGNAYTVRFSGNNAGTVNATGGTWTHTGDNGVLDILGGNADYTIGADLVHTGGGGILPLLQVNGISGGDILLTGNMTNTGGNRLLGMGHFVSISGGDITLTGTLSDTGGVGNIFQDIEAGATVTIANGLTVTNSSGTGLSLNNVAGTVNLNGTISLNNSAVDGLRAENLSGNVTVDDLVVDGAGDSAVNLDGSGSVSIAGLDITNASGAGLVASNITLGSDQPGQIQVQGGPALNLSNVTIALAGITFGSVEANNTGPGNDGIRLQNISGGDLHFDQVQISNAGARGIEVLGHSNDLFFDNVTINGGQRYITLAQSAGDVTLSNATLGGVTSASGVGISVEEQQAGSTINLNNADVTTGNAYTVRFSGNNAGTVNATGGTWTHTGDNGVLDILGGNADYTIGADLVHTGGGGILPLLQVNGISGGDILLTGNMTNTGGNRLLGMGHFVSISGGDITLTGTLSDTGGVGNIFQDIGAGATVTIANGLTVTNSSGTGLSLNNVAGTVNVGGTTSIDTTGDHGLTLEGTNGTISFGTLNIADVTNTGVDFEGFSGIFTANTLNVNGGTTAIDLTNAGGTITVTNGGTLENFTGTGVQFSRTDDTNDSANAQFIFGGGSITATGGAFVMDGIGLDETLGSYDFTGVTFSGPFRFPLAGGAVGDLFFVAANATGDGSGSSISNRASAATAQTRADTGLLTTFVFINDGDAVDFVSLGADGFTLNDDQVISGFGNDNSFGLDVPDNLIGDFDDLQIEDPGNGAADLVNTGGSTVTLGDGNEIGNVNLAGGTNLINGDSFTDFTLDGVTLAGATNTLFNLINPAGTITLVNLGLGAFSGGIANISGSAVDIDLSSLTVNAGNQGQRLVTISGQTGGTISFGDITSAGQGAGANGIIQVTGQTGGNLNFGEVAITGFNSSGNTAVSLAGSGGTVSFDALSVGATQGGGLSASGIGLGIGASAQLQAQGVAALNLSSVTVAGGINLGPVSAAGVAVPGVSLQNVTGNVSLGATSVNSTGAGVVLNGNTGAYSFGSLSVTNSGGTGVSFTNSGTVTVLGSGSLSSGNQTALNVANTTIGAGGLNFQSITSTGGSATGIILNNTGAGTLTVTGTGTAGSGGTIGNKTGANGSTTTGVGVSLNNTGPVHLNWMQMNDFDNYGIYGVNVNGFQFNNSVISGTSGNSAAAPQNEGPIRFNNLTGQALISNSSIGGGFRDNFQLHNNSGVLNRLVFDNVTFGGMSTAEGNDSVFIGASGTATVNVTVQDSVFTSARGDIFQMTAASSGGADLLFTGNAISNNHPEIATGGGGLTITGGDNSLFTLDINNNTFRDSMGHAVLIVKDIGTGSLVGSFANNTIGVAGVNNSGSLEGGGLYVRHNGGGTMTMEILNNSVHQYNNSGINMQAGAGVAQSGIFNLVVTGNTISNPGNNPAIGSAQQGLHLNSGVDPGDAFQVCFDAQNNTMTNSGRNGGVDARLRQRQNSTVQLPGYGGGATDTAAVQSYLEGRNVTPFTGAHAWVSTGFSGGGACL